MKAIILAGGLGTRLSEETETKPKPMVQIGDMPILWHVMKIYSAHGINDFVVCCGYKGYVIKEYFSNYFLHTSDVTFDLSDNRMELHHRRAEPWRITLVDTGVSTMTGGRLKRVRQYLGDDESFCMTYGDGVADVDVRALIAHHRSHGRLATVTAVSPPGRFGVLGVDEGGIVRTFTEKPQGEIGRINGGFFVLNSRVLDRIANDQTVFEKEPLENLATDGELSAFSHDGFWHPMDTLRDKRLLDALWAEGRAPWRVW